jgi:Ca2+-binding RTX toxin-like protein
MVSLAGAPSSFYRGGVFDFNSSEYQWYRNAIGYNDNTPSDPVKEGFLSVKINSQQVVLSQYTIYESGARVAWCWALEGSFSVDAGNKLINGSSHTDYQAYQSWFSDGSKTGANYEATNRLPYTFTNSYLDASNWNPDQMEKRIDSATWQKYFADLFTFKTSIASDGTGIIEANKGSSQVSTNPANSTTLKAIDFLATLDPAAVAGVASAKELFSANQIAIAASSWSGSLTINLVAVASNVGEILTGKQVDTNNGISTGSILVGGLGNDQLWGKAGWDIIDGGAGNDLIRGGNGRDILTGGAGSDEVHGDFGWNTYKSEIDGSSDLIALKSDQYLVNWIYGKAGNNSDGSKCDIIEGLDAIDKIRIIGVDTSDITFAANVTAKGLTGIGIYGKGALEALYTGGNLTLAQIQGMTSGDASAAAMANSISSYGWTQNPGTFVAS